LKLGDMGWPDAAEINGGVGWERKKLIGRAHMAATREREGATAGMN
jgi:hypothetical protein